MLPHDGFFGAPLSLSFFKNLLESILSPIQSTGAVERREGVTNGSKKKKRERDSQVFHLTHSNRTCYTKQKDNEAWKARYTHSFKSYTSLFLSFESLYYASHL